MSAGGSTRVIVFALFANLGIALSKFFGAYVSKSASLLAEAIHSLVDCTNQVFLLIGAKKSQRPPSESHPLGYGRETFFWSFIVAVMLFFLGGLFAIYEGIHKLSHTEPISSPWLALGILIFGIVLEGFSFHACWLEVKRQNPYPTLWEWFRKTTAAELLVIFTEDAAAMAGLIVAAVCVLIAWLTGNPIWDAYGSIAIGAILVIVAVLLSIEVKSLIIGEAPAIDYRSKIEEIARSVIPGSRILRLIAVQTGSSEVLVSYKIGTGSVTDVATLVRSLNQIETRVRQEFPDIRWQFVEPDDQA